MQVTNKLPDIRKLVLINAPIEIVWEYVSSAGAIATWWMPSTFEPYVGHEFRLHAGELGDSLCKVTEFYPPKGRHARIGFDWGKDWHITFRLVRFNTITEFTLIHSGWDAEKATEYGYPHGLVREIMDSEWEKFVGDNLLKVVEGRGDATKSQ